MVMLEHAHGHTHRARILVDDVSAGDDLRQVLANGFAHFLIVPQPVPRSAREQVVPLRKAQCTLLALAHGTAVLPVFRYALLLREESRDVAQCLLGAVLVVAVFLHQTLLHDGDLLACLIVRPRGRGHEPQHVPPLLEQILLDRLAHARVARELEFLSSLERDHRLANDLLAEGELARVGHLDLLLHRSQEPLIRRSGLAGDRVGDLPMIEGRLDLVQILLEELLRFVLERGEHRAVHVLLHPAVVELLARCDQMIDPRLLLLRIDASVAIDAVLEREEQLHARQAPSVSAGDGIGDRIDDETWANARESLVRRLLFQPHHLTLRHALDGLAGIEPQLLRKVEALALRLDESRQDREHRGEIEHVRIEVHVAERRRAGDQLLVDAGLISVGERIGDLDDHHPVEQRLVLLLLQELVELGEIRVRENRLIEIDEREAGNLDVLLLRHREQQVEKLALDLEDLDHLENPAARGVHRTRPGPGTRIALVADLRDLGEIDRADEVCDVGRRRVVRGISSYTRAGSLRQKDPLNRNANEIALVLSLDEVPRPRRELALYIDAVALAELRPQARRDEIEGTLPEWRALDGIECAIVRAAVLLETALEQDREGGFASRGRSEEQQQPPAHIRARSRGLEVFDDARERLVDTEQLALEELARLQGFRCLWIRALPMPAQHVPDVLMARACEGCGALGEDRLQKVPE